MSEKSFIELVDEAEVWLADREDTGERVEPQPGNRTYDQPVNTHAEYSDSVQWLTGALARLMEVSSGGGSEWPSPETPIPDPAEISTQVRKYLYEVDRRIVYDMMCRRLQYAKTQTLSQEVRQFADNVIADIRKEITS